MAPRESAGRGQNDQPPLPSIYLSAPIPKKNISQQEREKRGSRETQGTQRVFDDLARLTKPSFLSPKIKHMVYHQPGHTPVNISFSQDYNGFLLAFKKWLYREKGQLNENNTYMVQNIQEKSLPPDIFIRPYLITKVCVVVPAQNLMDSYR